MARKSGIWWHASRKCWYTSHGGKNQRLDPDKRTAELMWAKLVGKPLAKGDDLLVKQVLDDYLDWSEANHAESTHYRVRASVLSFAKSLPPALCIGELEPRHLSDWLDQLAARSVPRMGRSRSATTPVTTMPATCWRPSIGRAAPTSGGFATRH